MPRRASASRPRGRWAQSGASYRSFRLKAEATREQKSERTEERSLSPISVASAFRRKSVAEERTMRDLVQDFRYAARLLLRSPGFTFVAVAALALGIGANTAIFSVVDTLLLRPLPYADADRLAVVWEHNVTRNVPKNVTSPGNFIHWRELNQTFKELSAVSMTVRATLTGVGDATELPIQLVSGTLFGVLGVRPALGRDFTPQEDAPGVRVVMLSDRLWRQRFGADPSIVNRNVMLNGQPTLVVGVMPPGFSILDKSADVWSTIGFSPQPRTP